MSSGRKRSGGPKPWTWRKPGAPSTVNFVNWLNGLSVGAEEAVSEPIIGAENIAWHFTSIGGRALLVLGGR